MELFFGGTIGLIGDPAAMATREIYDRLRSRLRRGHAHDFQRVLVETFMATGRQASDTPSSLLLYDAVQRLAARGATRILLPCAASQVLLRDLESESNVPVVSMIDALRASVLPSIPEEARLGVLSSGVSRRTGLFRPYLPGRLVYPRAIIQEECLDAPLHAGCMPSPAVRSDLLKVACEDLLGQGAQCILAGAVEATALAPLLKWLGVPVIDIHELYLDYALAFPFPVPRPPFKIGVIGGIGPAATVDFLDKLVRATPAARDQDHVKVVVDHNPQIPDRTAHLQGRGLDPTLALYACAYRLWKAGASVIVMPCNTAHAYLDRLRAHLPLPFVDMPAETIAQIAQGPQQRRLGLLATSGTVDSRVYADAAARAGLSLITPNPPWQDKVMNAIYGARGIKAGFRDGECLADVLEAIHHLAERNVDVIILGCTELPLLFPRIEALPVRGLSVELVDPAMVLARRCVALASARHQDLQPPKRAGENAAGSANGASPVMISASRRPVAGPSVSP